MIVAQRKWKRIKMMSLLKVGTGNIGVVNKRYTRTGFSEERRMKTHLLRE